MQSNQFRHYGENDTVSRDDILMKGNNPWVIADLRVGRKMLLQSKEGWRWRTAS